MFAYPQMMALSWSGAVLDNAERLRDEWLRAFLGAAAMAQVVVAEVTQTSRIGHDSLALDEGHFDELQALAAEVRPYSRSQNLFIGPHSTPGRTLRVAKVFRDFNTQHMREVDPIAHGVDGKIQMLTVLRHLLQGSLRKPRTVLVKYFGNVFPGKDAYQIKVVSATTDLIVLKVLALDRKTGTKREVAQGEFTLTAGELTRQEWLALKLKLGASTGPLNKTWPGCILARQHDVVHYSVPKPSVLTLKVEGKGRNERGYLKVESQVTADKARTPAVSGTSIIVTV